MTQIPGVFYAVFCGLLCLGVVGVLAAQNLVKFTLKFYLTTSSVFDSFARKDEQSSN